VSLDRNRRSHRVGRKERQALARLQRDKAAAKRQQQRHRPAARGWWQAAAGGVNVLEPVDEYRGTTVQVCGLWPYVVGAGTPMVGVPLGLNLINGSTVCGDPISWFQQNLIGNPSVFVLGLPGLGKSTIVRRMAAGGAGFGALPLVLGDLKPDYVELIKALGGQVITLGRGRGHLNVLDPGEAIEAAERLRKAGKEKERAQVLADAHGRRHTMVSALLTILRKEPPTDREESIIDRALKVLDERNAGVPVLGDLLKVIQEAPQEIRDVALDRGDDARYKKITENLEAAPESITLRLHDCRTRSARSRIAGVAIDMSPRNGG